MGCLFAILIFLGMASLGGALGIHGEMAWGLWGVLILVVIIAFESAWNERHKDKSPDDDQWR